MADRESNLKKQALNVSTFAKIKNLVRELEDDEKRIGADFANSEIEVKLNPGQVAWFVAYKTAVAQVTSEGNVTPDNV